MEHPTPTGSDPAAAPALAVPRRGVVAAAGGYVVAAPPVAAAVRSARLDLPPIPAGPTVAFTGAECSSGAQPLRLDGMSHLRIPAVVCGAGVSVILDTGAARSVIDRAFARRLGLATRPGFDVAGITGDAHGELAEDVSVAIGGLRLERLAPGVLDLARASPSADGPAAMILGRELFQRTVADLDFARGAVTFRGAGAVPALPPRQVVALGQTPRGTPHIPVSIEDGPEIEAGLDIGYNGSLLISRDYAERAGLLQGRPLSTVASIGAEGMSVNAVATVRALTLAGVTLSGPPAEIPARWNRSVPAIIGLDVIKKFRMLTDYGRGRIGLLVTPRELAIPLPKDRSGIGAAPTREGLEVIYVASGSPAERCGLQAGDRIAAVDGEPATLDYVRTHPRLGARAAGTAYRLRLADGRSLTLTLADYY